MQTYLVYDLGGTFIKFALMQADGTILEKDKVASPVDSLDHLLTALGEIGARYTGRCAGVAVSMPGRIDTARGIAHTGGSFTFLHDTPMGELLSQRLGLPVTLANDGKCAANAEAWSGALADVADGAVIVLGTGTGGGIVLGHRVWMGHTFAAAEFSALPTDFDAVPRGITSLADPNVNSIWAAHMSAGGLLGYYARRKGLADTRGLDGLAFFAAYDAGDAAAAAALADLGRSAAAGIYALQAVLDLERYAIGGGISARPEVTDAIRAAVDAQFAAIPFTPFGKPEIVRCRYGNDANLLGALRFCLDREK